MQLLVMDIWILSVAVNHEPLYKIIQVKSVNPEFGFERCFFFFFFFFCGVVNL